MRESLFSGAIGAFFVAAFQFLYGDEPVRVMIISLFFLLIILDWIAGLRAARIDGSYASEYGIEGAFRTVFLLLTPAIGHLVDVIVGLPGVAFGFIVAAFALHIWKSMTANAIRAGWDKWVPEWAMRAVADELEHKIARAVKRRQEKETFMGGMDSDNQNHA